MDTLPAPRRADLGCTSASRGPIGGGAGDSTWVSRGATGAGAGAAGTPPGSAETHAGSAAGARLIRGSDSGSRWELRRDVTIVGGVSPAGLWGRWVLEAPWGQPRVRLDLPQMCVPGWQGIRELYKQLQLVTYK